MLPIIPIELAKSCCRIHRLLMNAPEAGFTGAFSARSSAGYVICGHMEDITWQKRGAKWAHML